MIKVAVVDDHPFFRDGVVQCLEQSSLFEVTGLGSSAEDAVRICSTSAPEILLLDMNIPGGGLSAVAAISKDQPHIRIVILSAGAEDAQVRTAMRCGAKAYILKDVGRQQLIEALVSVHGGATYLAPSIAVSLLAYIESSSSRAADPLARLSGRERQILGHIAGGLSNKEVATALHLSDKTIKHYTTNLMRKLGVRNRTQAALTANGWARPVASTTRPVARHL
jgi:two-component system, NarL family, nitrate/nitrite response regulator NarL